MDEKLKDQDILLVKEKDKDELNVVKGKLETISPKSENQQDFMKVDKHGMCLKTSCRILHGSSKIRQTFFSSKPPLASSIG
jgi:hypothetical protein